MNDLYHGIKGSQTLALKMPTRGDGPPPPRALLFMCSAPDQLQ